MIELIPVGAENAISRSELSRLCGLNDRQMRQEIENLRHNGATVLNMQDGNGYFVPSEEDIEKVRAAYKTNERRAKSILHYNKNLKEWLKQYDAL